MEKDFIPYEESLALKELGFDEPCFGVFPDGSKLVKINGEPRNWNDNVINGETTSAPTFSQAFRWFRDKRGLVSWISFRIDLKKKYLWYITDVKNIATRDGDYIFDILIESYEEAELACLKKLIVLLKANNIETPSL
jgi:hypothetical protein